MSHNNSKPNPEAQHPTIGGAGGGDTLAAYLADAIADRINYDHLADLITQKLRQANNTAPDPDELIEVEAIRRQLGAHKRKGTISYPTFQRNYIDTGLLTYVPGPNRARRYVRRGDWENLKSEIKK